MIVHYSVYSDIYTKFSVNAMIISCWVFSYGSLSPALFEVWGWGKKILTLIQNIENFNGINL